MQLLSLANFDVAIEGHFLFHIDNLSIESGEKIALVGANGSGKSTFLNSILKAGNGGHNESLIRRGLWSYFAQQKEKNPEVENSEQVSRWKLRKLMENSPHPLSGGEEVRFRLAAAFSKPHDILVLDEPTAHLDAEGIRELQNQLAREQSLILVSHDRFLINLLCNRTLVIEDGHLIDFPGNYDAWKIQQEENRLSQMREYENARQEKQRLTFVMREQERRAKRTQRKPRKLSKSETKAREFGAVGKSIGGKQKSLSAAAKNTAKRIERLGEIQKPVSLPQIRPDFSITDPPQNRIILEIEDLTFGYPGQEKLFCDAGFALKRNTRTAIVGENGSGKSTLLKLILKGHPQIRLVPKAKLGYFDQNFENINFRKTILENIHESSVQNESVNRNVLFRMGFPADTLNKNVTVLSGGELTKLSFAKLLVSDCNVLLIDEPSNYLDISSYEAIENLLLDFEGSMIFCSHDRYFLERIAEQIWEIKEKKLILK